VAEVQIKDIKKYFGEVRALDGVDLSIKEGEFLVLLGPSGCGKTTLMRIIAGLEKPTAGEIFIDERLVHENMPPRARNIAMVFQSYALYPHMKIFDNIAFPLKSSGVPKGVIQEKVRQVAKMLHIDHLLYRKPRQLSGGERQRVALARAIVRDPILFLMDEPLSNLDAKLRTSARDELKQFQRRVGITTLFVTHDQVEALGMGDRIAVMNQGRIHQVGTPREVYDDPADTFVATFLGTPPMNLLELSDQIVGFRPERFLPKTFHNVQQDELVSFPFLVTRIEYLGSEQIVYGTTVGDVFHNVKVMASLPATTPVSIDEGQGYEFAIQAKDLRFFDKATRQRVEGSISSLQRENQTKQFA
jgi:multiple sugar transport system ATP-binding protein